jgi:hypothetical protein
MPSIAFAPCSPISHWSCAVTSPRTACSPNAQPATLITITSRGAMEKRV